MTNSVDIAIAAYPLLSPSELDSEDRHVSGVYSVTVDKGLMPAAMASAALDVFHSRCPVNVLEDFHFLAFDPLSGLVLTEAQDHEAYSKQDLGRDLQRISDQLPSCFAVTVTARHKDGDCALGTVHLVAEDALAAQRKAFDLLWDARLDTTGNTPDYQIEQLSPDDGSINAPVESTPAPRV